MAIRYEFDNGSLNIWLSGRLDFAMHQAFSEAYCSETPEIVSHYILDMTALTYLDSSALGMLLLLRDHAQPSAKISIVNCSPDVCKIFEISNFNKLFDIEMHTQ